MTEHLETAGARQRSGDRTSSRPVPWRSRRVRARAYQIVLALGVLALLFYMGRNAGQALAARGMSIGFGFLTNQSGFTLAESVLPFHSTDDFLRAFSAGLGNTLWVSAVSLVFATVFGVLLGIARLSSNWLLARVASAYVEAFRNTPQLIQIVFWYTLFTLLPGARQALHGGDWWYLSKRGLTVAWLADAAAAWVLLAAAVLGWIAIKAIARWIERRRHRLPRYAVPAVCAAWIVAVWFALGAPSALDRPHLAGFNFEGGKTLSPEFLALALGLILYFSAYIAEIVRSGIQSVSRGQIEAAKALNLRGSLLYRRVVLPLALRVIVPPISAQYISLIKTSALGVAVGYPELFNVTNSIMTASGHTLECLFIMGCVYLVLALLVSAAMNLFNRAVAMRGTQR